MKIDKIKSLFQEQLALDHSILSVRNLDYNTTWDRRYLALLVEIGELANTTRCFKFWSHKKAEPSEIILEEFCDVLHFALSLGLTYNYIIDEVALIELDINMMFIRIYQTAQSFYLIKGKEEYQKLISLIFSLAIINLEFDENSIVEGYQRKKQINYQRQEDNY